jgi:hypothetical protein
MQFAALLVLALSQGSAAIPTDISFSQLLAFNSPAMTWTNATSKFGKPFRIGTLQTDQAVEKRQVSPKNPFTISVNWGVTPGAFQSISTSPDVQSIAAIDQYYLNDIRAGGGIPAATQFLLWFHNTQTYDYYFTDQSGDVYEINTYIRGDHTLNYDSTYPIITTISGS